MLKLTEPTLLLDKVKCQQNIQQIVEKAKKNNVSLRPHFKTHQSHEIGCWFRNLGVEKITASSLKMAEYFAEDGWQDITVAFPLNVHEIKRINSLAEKINLNVLIISVETIVWLAKELKFPLNVFIEIDCGDNRTGVNPNDFPTIDEILKVVGESKLINFKGFLTHAGHSYAIRQDREAIAKLHQESVGLMQPLREKYSSQFADLIISYGDTPTCSLMEDFAGIDEIRPGNLVFFDLVQSEIGSCSREQIAVAMACPVVAKYPERNEFVIYGGAVHHSKDSILFQNGEKFFGKIIRLTETGWDATETGAYLESLSQEHGIVSASSEFIDEINIGDFIGVLPVHSCLTVDLNSSYLTLDGEVITKFRFYE